MKVPVYNNLESTVNVTPQSRFAAPKIENYQPEQDAQMGQALMNAGQATYKIMEDIDNSKVQKAANQLRTGVIDLEHGSEGFKAHTGENALKADDQGRGLHDVFAEKYKKVSDLATADLNERQRIKYEKYTAPVKNDFDARLMDHVVTQQKVFNKDTQLGRIAIAQDAAALDYKNPSAVLRSRNEVIDATQKLYADQGLASDHPLVVAETIDNLSKLHSGALSEAINNKDFAYADAYYSKASGDMTPRDRSVFGKAIKIGADQAEAQHYSDLSIKNGLSLNQALEGAKKYEGEKREAFEKQLTYAYHLKEMGRAKLEKDSLDYGIQQLQENNNALDPVFKANLIHTFPEAALKLENIQANRIKTPDPVQSAVLYAELSREQAVDPENSLKRNYAEYAGKLTQAQIQTLTNASNKIAQGDVVGINDIKTKNEIAAEVLKEVDIPKQDKDLFNASLMDRLTQENEASIKSGRGSMKKSDGLVLARGLTKDYIEQNGNLVGYHSKTKGYNIPKGKDSDYVVALFDDIPKEFTDKLVSAVKAKRGIIEINKNPALSNDDLTSAISKPLSKEEKQKIEDSYTSMIRKNGKLQHDKDNNWAIVYPNGTYEEL
jgi:hypothetical protein